MGLPQLDNLVRIRQLKGGARRIFVDSGYAIWGGTPGNVLLAFSVDGG